MDILAAYQAGKTVAWFENDGNADPTWTAENISTGTTYYAIAISAADMNGDGVMDVLSLTARYGERFINWHENSENEVFYCALVNFT